jgi:DNA (cytosine-5)-methyltransferase 1
MGRPLLLDLYCGAGGCAVGYHRAGFDVIGVDNRPQPRYPFPLIVADALDVLRMLNAGWSEGPSMPDGRRYKLEDFAAIHASPPCQRYSRAAFEVRHKEKHPDLLPATRAALENAEKPWVIENVDGAPVSVFSIKLCGLMFGLKVFRHRWFESSHLLFAPHHPSHRGKIIGKDGMCCVVGHGGGVSRRMRDQMKRLSRDGSGGQQNKAEWEEAMGIDWMTRNQLSQAIPPAYTHYVGEQLLAVVNAGGDQK